MTVAQVLSVGIIAATMGLFVWGRLRYDLVALMSLLAAIAAGIVPADKAFTGFSDDIVIIVASALLVSAAVARSGVIEDVLQRVGPYLTTTTLQVAVLAGAVTLLSSFVKNIGALAMLMPVAFTLARRTQTSPSALLMPMAFGSLLGGIVTLIGTSPNIIVSRVRAEIVGEPFRMFDFAPVGLGLAIAGVIFLTFGWRLLPRNRKAATSIEAAFNLEGYTTEVDVPEGSSLVGKTVADLETMSEDEVEVIMVVRGRGRRYAPGGSTTLNAGDILLLEGEPEALERVVGRAGLKLVHDAKGREKDTPGDEVGVMEAVVGQESPLVDKTVAQVRLYDRYGVSLLAVSRAGRRITQRMRAVRLRPGDVIVLQGDLSAMPEVLGALRCLPLAGRNMRLGRGRRSLLPILVLAAAMALLATNMIPVSVAFFGAAVVLLLIGSLSLREAYEAVDWPDSRDARRADPGRRYAALDRRHRPDRRAAVAGRNAPAANRRARPDDGRRNGGDAVPQQCGDRFGHGADCRDLRQIARLQPRPVPDGGRHRSGLRLPHADRAPMQLIAIFWPFRPA